MSIWKGKMHAYAISSATKIILSTPFQCKCFTVSVFFLTPKECLCCRKLLVNVSLRCQSSTYLHRITIKKSANRCKKRSSTWPQQICLANRAKCLTLDRHTFDWMALKCHHYISFKNESYHWQRMHLLQS